MPKELPVEQAIKPVRMTPKLFLFQLTLCSAQPHYVLIVCYPICVFSYQFLSY